MPVLQILPAMTTDSEKTAPSEGARHLEVPSGTRVLDAAMRQGVPIPTRCGGVMACLTCRIRHRSTAEDLSPPSPEEQNHLRRLKASPDERLACQARVLRDTTIELLSLSPEHPPEC